MNIVKGTLSSRNNEILLTYCYITKCNKYTPKLDNKILKSKTEAIVCKKSAGLMKFDGNGDDGCDDDKKQELINVMTH